MERRERRGEWLRARWALGEGRLGRDVDLGGKGLEEKAGTGRKKSTMGAADETKARRVRQKKERLSYAVERLQLQAGQKERQLRKSMAAVEGPVGGNGGDGAGDKKSEEEDDELDF